MTMTQAMEKHFSVAQVAEIWGISVITVRRIFDEEPGVLHIETPRLLNGRKKTTLRIPESVLARVHERRSARRSPLVIKRRSGTI